MRKTADIFNEVISLIPERKLISWHQNPENVKDIEATPVENSRSLNGFDVDVMTGANVPALQDYTGFNVRLSHSDHIECTGQNHRLSHTGLIESDHDEIKHNNPPPQPKLFNSFHNKTVIGDLDEASEKHKDEVDQNVKPIDEKSIAVETTREVPENPEKK